VTASTTAPYFETDGVNGNSVAACTTQTGCQVDAAICTTGADVTQLQCTTPVAGYYEADVDFMLSGAPRLWLLTAEPRSSVSSL